MRVDAVRAVPDGWRVHLADGTRLDISVQTRDRYHLDPDVLIDTPTQEALRAESALHGARADALRLLARAEHTARGLERKLLRRGHDAEVTRAVIRALEAEGSLDDQRAAEAWVEQQRSRRPVSRAALLAGLARHGVSRETAERVVAGRVEAASELDAAVRLFRKLYPTPASRRELADRALWERALRRLVNRGFTPAVARRAVERPVGGVDVDVAPTEGDTP